MDDGQATLEYAGVVAVVAVVLLLGGAVAAGEGARVADAVGTGVRRALCVVLGGDCFGIAGPRACVVASDARRRDARADLVMFRLGDGRTVLREERADGSIVVTVVQSQRFGAALDVGARLSINGRGVKSGGEAGADGRGAYTRTWIVPDRAAADRLVRRLADSDVPVGGVTVLLGRIATRRSEPGPAPQSRTIEMGAGAQAEGALRALGLGGKAELLGAATAGVRVDRDGGRTLLLRQDGELSAALTAPLGTLAGGIPAQTSLELALDRAGEPVALTLRAARGVHGRAQLGPYDAQGGSRLELEARLDLADPQARALTDRLVRGLRSADPGALAAARALGARLRDRARVDLRLLATDRSERTRGATAGLGVRLGAEVVTVDESARLVAAVGREPGLGWRRRMDCGAPA